MVRILLYIASLLNLAQVVLALYLSIINEYTFFLSFLFVAIIAGILVQIGLYIHYEYLQNNISIPSKPNGDKPKILRIGVWFLGSWRKYADTYVGYSFFTLVVFPLFPTGCYRYRVVEKSKVNICGSEEWSGKELFCIYAYYYGGMVWSILLGFQIIVILNLLGIRY